MSSAINDKKKKIKIKFTRDDKEKDIIMIGSENQTVELSKNHFQ